MPVRSGYGNRANQAAVSQVRSRSDYPGFETQVTAAQISAIELRLAQIGPVGVR